MKYIGIDFGTRRVGIAVSDKEGTLAFPRAVFENDDKFFERLREMIKEEGVEKIVVGMPKALSGKETAMTTRVKNFIEELTLKQKELIVVQEDEVFSTKTAKENAREDMRDASAAALILQQYLDRE